MIKNHLEKTKITILGEETGLDTLNDDNLTWVIDPLDGTSNYFRDLPACCVSIALIGKDEGHLELFMISTRMTFIMHLKVTELLK